MFSLAMPDRSRIRHAHFALFCLNLAFACSSAILASALTSLTHNEKGNGWWSLLYCFYRGAVRINRFFHLTSSNPFFGRLPNPGSQIGVELMYSISTLGLVACIWLICRFLLGARFLAVLLNPVAGIVALMALPAISVVLSPRVWLLGRVHSIWTIVVAEFVCIGVMSFIYRKHPFSTLTIAFLMLLHYGLWVLALWDRTITVPFYDLISPVAFWFSSIISAVLWLLYLKGCSPSPTQTTPRTSTSRYWVAFSAFALLFLAALLWLPGKGYALTRAKNPQSLTLQMWRSRCMGRCPVYQVTVHGNGEVEYEGSEFVRDRGPKHLILTQQQIQTILAGFDRADFFALEDSAFVFAFDTPRVGIKIDIDGKSKEVWSDTSYAGARNGPQAHFLEATHALDQIVGTNQWTECPGGRCGP